MKPYSAVPCKFFFFFFLIFYLSPHTYSGILRSPIVTLKLDFEKIEFQNKDIFLISLENKAKYRIKKKKKKSPFSPNNHIDMSVN